MILHHEVRLLELHRENGKSHFETGRPWWSGVGESEMVLSSWTPGGEALKWPLQGSLKPLSRSAVQTDEYGWEPILTRTCNF
jgi:hypothetical protein